MNSIGTQTSPAPSPETAVPAATGRVSGVLADLESLLHSLEARLESVLEPNNEKNAGAALPPGHSVPLANTLHGIADRVGALVNQAESLIKRLHV